MTITADRKTEIIQEYRTHGDDTGSPEVQIAILSERIRGLTEHFKTHRKDFAARRGLLKLVGRRTKLLRFLKKGNPGSFQELVQRLGIRAS